MPVYFLCGLPVQLVCNKCGGETTRHDSDDKKWAEGWIAKKNDYSICPKCLSEYSIKKIAS